MYFGKKQVFYLSLMFSLLLFLSLFFVLPTCQLFSFFLGLRQITIQFVGKSGLDQCDRNLLLWSAHFILHSFLFCFVFLHQLCLLTQPFPSLQAWRRQWRMHGLVHNRRLGSRLLFQLIRTLFQIIFFINKNQVYATARHYEQAKHGSVASLKFWGTEKIAPLSIGSDIINKLLQREACWIFTLNTIEPYGLNEEMNLSCFLWLCMYTLWNVLFFTVCFSLWYRNRSSAVWTTRWLCHTNERLLIMRGRTV